MQLYDADVRDSSAGLVSDVRDDDLSGVDGGISITVEALEADLIWEFHPKLDLEQL